MRRWSKIKIVLIGYGQMGHMLEQIAIARNHTIIARIDPKLNDSNYREITAANINDADVCLDFSNPLAVVDTVKKVAAQGKNLVIGTTGWYEHLPAVQEIVGKKVGMMYSSNYSRGIYLFNKIVEEAARCADKIGGYDVAMLELHHSKKGDSPSGTAKTIAEIIKTGMKSKDTLVFEKLDRKILPNELHVASVRCGSFAGTHSVFLDSTADTIELTHTARTREGFALGAIMAAEWLVDKKGVFTFADMMKEIQ